MAGFGKVSFVGEFFNQLIVNVFWFRSTEWLPGQGNPFDDVLAFLDGVVNAYKTKYLACKPDTYTLLRAEAVGYGSDFSIVTSSPLVRTIAQAGGIAGADTNGAATSCNIGLRCGEQVEINGLVKSKRNRGYLSIGPLADNWVDDYSHLVDATFNANLSTFAQALDDGITILAPAVTLTPIRIHEVWQRLPDPMPDVLLGRTYSDIKGYTLPRLSSFRRSRHPEA